MFLFQVGAAFLLLLFCFPFFLSIECAIKAIKRLSEGEFKHFFFVWCLEFWGWHDFKLDIPTCHNVMGNYRVSLFIGQQGILNGFEGVHRVVGRRLVLALAHLSVIFY